MPDERNGDLANNGKLKRKEYERELARLHVEFVKLQRWVVHKGLKVCILFEGRDGAGKGGTIKAITERVSPRVFRVIALPAPTERRKVGSNESTARGRYITASTSNVTLLTVAMNNRPRMSTARTVPNRTCIRSTLLPRTETIITPTASERR